MHLRLEDISSLGKYIERNTEQSYTVSMLSCHIQLEATKKNSKFRLLLITSVFTVVCFAFQVRE